MHSGLVEGLQSHREHDDRIGSVLALQFKNDRYDATIRHGGGISPSDGLFLVKRDINF